MHSHCPHADVKAALHKLAAEIELAAPASERRCVNTEDFNESGRACPELVDATRATPRAGWRCSRSWWAERGTAPE